MRIASIELTNVGVFDHQFIEFRPKTDPEKAEIHILAGINGSGKSTILYALASVFDPSDQLKRRFRFVDDKSAVAIGCVNGSDVQELVKIGFQQERTDLYRHPFALCCRLGDRCLGLSLRCKGWCLDVSR